jgi:predicted metal-binding membrane protein
MTAAAPAAQPRASGERGELAQASAAVRARAGVVAALLVLAGLAWWSTADRMAGMDAGPGTALGALGWFLGVWVVMMAAMMFPSLAPTAALYARMTRQKDLSRPLLFAAAYLIVWGAAGLLAYAVFRLGSTLLGATLDWNNGGRWFAAGVLTFAAVYELTPLKDVCLAKCRSPLGFLLGSWRDGRVGALQMGGRHALWCLGCCWALMAALFALGVMSITWMVVVAVLIAGEKVLPWRRTATWGAAAILLVLAVGVAAAPHSVPGLVVPGGAGASAMHSMSGMSSGGAMPSTHGGMSSGGAMPSTHGGMSSGEAMPSTHGGMSSGGAMHKARGMRATSSASSMTSMR